MEDKRKKTSNQRKGRRRPSKSNQDRSRMVDKAPLSGEFSNDSFSKATKYKGNDSSFYSHNPELLEATGRFSFNNPIGAAQKYTYTTNQHSLISGYYTVGMQASELAAMPNYLEVPGLVSLEISLVPGFSVDYTSAVNLASRNIYSVVRRQQSGAKNYDAPDLMMYLLTMDNIFSYYTWIQRLYGLANRYNVMNRYLPDALITANHVDPDNLRKHISELYGYIQLFASRAKAFPVPTQMKYFIRHAEMFANVYTDGDNDKAQMYIFVPYAFWAFNETFSSAARGSLDMQPVGYNQGVSSPSFKLMTVDDIIALGEKLLMGVISSQDAGVIGGDILKAYGGETVTIGSTPIDYTVQPVYNEEILMQIHNARSVGSFSSNSSITQNDENQIIFSPALEASDVRTLIIDCAYKDPTPEQVMAMTRFAAIVQTGGSSSTGVAGAEMVNHMCIFKYVVDSTKREPVLGFAPINTTYNQPLSDPPSLMEWLDTIKRLNVLSDLGKFDWHPMVHVAFKGENVVSHMDFGDFENYTLMNDTDLSKLNEVALLSLFGVPAK